MDAPRHGPPKMSFLETLKKIRENEEHLVPGRSQKMLQNAYLLAKIGADAAENEQHLPKICQNLATTPRVRLPGLALRPGPEREARRRRLEFHTGTETIQNQGSRAVIIEQTCRGSF